MRVPSMKSLLPLSLAVAIAAALPACNADRTGPASDASPDAAAPAATEPSPATDVPQATTPQASDTTSTPPPAAPAPGSGLARFDGYGDMRFGMTEAEAREAWGGALNGEPGNECHYLNPVWGKVPSYFAFMIDGGRFVRYDVGNDKEVAPGGGRVGMSEAEIDAAYRGRVAKSPHKYVDGGKYLRVKADDGGDGALVFETDAAGKVKEWHAGLAPQVDWIEGCS